MGEKGISGASPQEINEQKYAEKGAQDLNEQEYTESGAKDLSEQEYASVDSQDLRVINKIVDGMNLFDDDLMSKVFDGNIEATEVLLRIMLKRKDIRVLEVIGQYDMQNPIVKGREIRLDIKASDSKGNVFNVEVQRDRKGSHNRRARFHTAMVDSRMLKEGQEFKDIKDSYVIFICQHDKFKEGKPIYHIDKVVRETGKRYLDGSHVIFVNGKYKGDDEIGRLMHDFNCLNSKDMYYKPLADGVRHFKETEKGRENMCDAVEKYGDKREETTKVNIVENLMSKMNWTLDQALTASGIEGPERAAIAKQLRQ